MSKEKQIELLEKQLAFWKGQTTCLIKALDGAEETAKRYAELLDKTEEELYAESVNREWISVDERLPETEGDYLVWNKEQKKIEIRFFYRLPPHYPVESHPEIREYFGNFVDYKRITHWMPLPEAPKGGAE